MNLRDLTPDEVRKLQLLSDSKFHDWIEQQRPPIPEPMEPMLLKAWRQAFSDGLKAYLLVQAPIEPKPNTSL